MIQFSHKTRLLTGVALGAGLLVSAQPASAQCATVGQARTCATTVTTDTSGNGPVDRNGLYDTSAGAASLTVTGAVTGLGLAASPTASGANTLTVTNNGSVQVDAGNLATAGGSAALNVNAAGATNVVYTGTGSVTNLGTAGNGLEFQMTGTGNLTATTGGNVTSAVGGTGILANATGTAGNLSVTTATGTTVRGDLVGVYAVSNNAAGTGTVTVVNNASVGSLAAAPNTLDTGVAAETLGLGAVSVTNNGAVGSATDRATNTAVLGSILNATSAANLTVAGTGAAWSSGPFGVRANNTGTGTTTVNYTGVINNTGATGLSVSAGAGAVTVTAGAVTAATDGINVTSTGTQSITANGVTTGTIGSGIASDTTGTRTIIVGTGGNVTGATQAILLANTGGGSITNSGIIGATSAGLAINAGTATAPVTVTNNAGATVNGRLTLGAGADVVTNAGTMSTSGISDFGAGADTLTNSGTITTTAATTLLGLETVNNSGTLNANFGLTFDGGATVLTNTGTINSAGTIDFGAGADTFANSGAGILNLTGNTVLVGLETLTNSGRINLNTFTLTGPAVAFNNTGTFDTSGSAALGGFTSFSNAGTLDLAPGTFTVPAAVFTNTGTILADEGASTITGQTSFANSGTIDLQDGVANDTLTINSAFVGSGGSNLLVDFEGFASDRLVINGAASGSTAINAAYLGGGLNLDGVLVVDATTATANAFVLGAVTGETPLVDVSLIQDGGDFFLITAPTAATFNPLVVPGFATDLWYQSADEVFAETVKPATTEGFSFWGEGYASRDRRGERNEDISIDGFDFEINNRIKTTRYGLQGGIDYGFGGARIGLTGGYGWAKANGNADADLKADGWNLGVYGQFGGITGFHGEFLLKHDRYNAEFDDGAFDGVDFDIRATGIDGSLGYRFGMGSANLDLLAGLSHVRTKVDDINAFGFNYDISRITSTRGRAGVRAVFGGSLSPYVSGTIYREFNRNRSVEFFDGANFYDVDTNGRGTWGRIEAGLGGNDGPGPILAAYGDFGDRKALGFRAGFRFGGRVAEALPPPPPPAPMAPPPPPPPATQTCPDGSVILATDACPPPPPPPPPMAEPERG